jgi:hypothetical protein
MIGRDEDLYRQNLINIKKLSKCDFHIKADNNRIFKNNINDINKLNKSMTIKSSKLDDSSSTISRQIVDLTIKYHLPDDDKHKDKNKNIEYYNLYLNDINQLTKVRDLRQEINSQLYNVLKSKNIEKYSIQKIALLTPLGFLSDDKILLDYRLRRYDYTIQALITYKKNQCDNCIINNNNELAPKELIPKLDKLGYKCEPSIIELCRKTCEELKSISNFKIYNQFGEVEFKEPVNLLGVNLNNEVTIEKDMIDTGEKLNYWSIFKLYNFHIKDNNIDKCINNINRSGGKFISYNNNELIWEYKANNIN